MGVLKDSRERSFQKAKDALEYIYNTEYQHIFLYDSNRERLSKEIHEFYMGIKERNREIGDINKQMVATNPYFWDDIDGCLAVRCAEIGISPVEETLGTIALFTGFNKNVLVIKDEEEGATANKIGIPGMKAFTSLAMLGCMI